MSATPLSTGVPFQLQQKKIEMARGPREPGRLVSSQNTDRETKRPLSSTALLGQNGFVLILLLTATKGSMAAPL